MIRSFLNEIREQHGYTQAHVAKLIGTNVANYSLIERIIMKPAESRHYLMRFTDTFKLEYDAIKYAYDRHYYRVGKISHGADYFESLQQHKDKLQKTNKEIIDHFIKERERLETILLEVSKKNDKDKKRFVYSEIEKTSKEAIDVLIAEQAGIENDIYVLCKTDETEVTC